MKLNNRLKLRLFLILVLLLVSLIWRFAISQAAFNPNNLMDDAVFDNTSSMSSGQIDNWLNQFPNSCISPNSGFQARVPSGYSAAGGFTFGGFVSAGQVIAAAAQAYGINPQVLLVTLEKEQSLISGRNNFSGYCNNGDEHKYAAAVGYGCPDGGTVYNWSGVSLYKRNGVERTTTGSTCVNSAAKAGFSQQIIRAAWLFKFGEQRSKGNTGWAVIKGSWDNSDDLSTCYGGPMTQGFRKRCPSDSSATFYDGYITIDGSATHMDTGSTAALYWYTPHFHGNQIFDSLFSQWFGSTSYYEPVGASLYNQTSTGNIFLAITDTNTRYYVASWAQLQNYNLTQYQIIPSDDATINQFTDGGGLTNLVSENGGVYLVNNGAKYHIPGPATCTDWAFDCFNANQVKNFGSFQASSLSNGGELPALAFSNSVVYKMVGGQRSPLLGPQTMSDLGYSWAQVLALNGSNVTQPLGPLLATAPVTLSFAPDPDIFYFDGQKYHYINGPATLSAWGLDKSPIVNPPASSYNASGPPLDQALNIWSQVGSDRYLIDGGRKFLLSADQQSYWPSASYQTFSAGLAGSLPAASLTSLVYASPDFYKLDASTKRPIPSVDDVMLLNTFGITKLSRYSLSFVADGPMAFGSSSLVWSSLDSKIYVITNNKRLYIPGPGVFNSYNFNWGKIRTYSESDMSAYPTAGDLPLTVNASQGYSFVYKGVRNMLSTSQTSDYGLKATSYMSVPDALLSNVTSRSASAFFRNEDNGAIYYGSGGALHYVTSNSSFNAYGGQRYPTIPCNSDIIASFVIAQPI